MQEIVVTGIIPVTHSVDTIMPRDIRGIGKIARDAEEALRLKCMSGTEQMNIILKN